MEEADGGGRLKVAFDATPLLGPRTGVGVFCAGALDGLAGDSSFDMVAFAVSWRRRRGIVPHLPRGVRVLDRPIPARPVHRAWEWFSAPPFEWWSGSVDVVHGTNFVVPPARRAARVATVHDLTTVRFPEMCEASTRAFPSLVRRAIGEGAWVHTPSEFVANEVVELLGADPGRVRAVHHGIGAVEVPASPSPPNEPEVQAEPRGPYVLALGTVEPRKDYPGLVRSFDLLAPEHPDLSLVIAGADGWGVGAFEDAVASSKFADRIVRLGYVSERRRAGLVQGARVFAYPSVYEGFGLPPLEAMDAGVPVVATRTGALPEVVGDGAALVPQGDPTALAEALGRLIGDEQVRAELVAKGRRQAARFSWGACADGLASLYRDATGSG